MPQPNDLLRAAREATPSRRDLSEAAQRDRRVSVGLRAFSAYQEARGHALAGDADTADRKVEEASELAALAVAVPDGSPEWTYWYDAAFPDAARADVPVHR